MKKKTAFTVFSSLFVALFAVVSIAPFVHVIRNSFMTDAGFSARSYYDVFLSDPEFLVRFWKSILMCVAIAVGQLLASILAGYGFAKCRFPGRNLMFFLLMLLMILPIQVTLVPNYIMLDQIHLLNTYHALIWPSIFVPLGTFILRQSFNSIPDSIIDAAQLDGCGTARTISLVAVPMNRSGIVCVLLLCFIDGWNMVEQPITYLKDFAQYPLSVALAYALPANASFGLVCCLLAFIPPLFLFTYFNQELVEGITLAEVK